MSKEQIINKIHIVILAIALLSPLLLSYQIVLIGVLLNYLQLILFQGCILSRAEYGNSETWFVYELISKFGFRPDKKKFGFFGKFILPPLVLITALVIQIGFGFIPIVSRLF